MAPSRTAAPARYRAEATTPDGPIVYRTDDRDELIPVVSRHAAAAGNPLVAGVWDDQAEAYVLQEAA